MKTDYANVGIPMMPVVRGEEHTRNQILVYTVLLAPFAIAPWLIGGTSWVYGSVSVVLSVFFFALAWPVGRRERAENDPMKPEILLFKFSIYYLFILFAALVADRLLFAQGMIGGGFFA